MKLIIFGASGKTGHELVRQALDQHHEVTAFVRDAEKLSIRHDRLDIHIGHLNEIPLLMHAIRGHDAVISALGAASPFTYDPLVVWGFSNICAAMKSSGVERLIYLSPLTVKETRGDAGFFMHYIAPILLRTEVRGHEEREAIIRASTLRWTITQAPLLTLGPHTGKFTTGTDSIYPGFLPKLSRADVADAMLQQLVHDDAVYKTIRILPTTKSVSA